MLKSVKQWLSNLNDRGVKVSNPVADRVFMTGDVWPKEVQKFQVSAYGFSSYNSSDVIFKVKKTFLTIRTGCLIKASI